VSKVPTPTPSEGETNSSLSCYRKCPREYFYRYVLLKDVVHTPNAMMFGKAMHAGLAAWWTSPATTLGCDLTDASKDDRVGDALEAMHNSAKESGLNKYDVCMGDAMLAAYESKWGDAQFSHIEVNVDWSARFGSTSNLLGSFDGIVVDGNGTKMLLEHKTTSLGIGAGSDYMTDVHCMNTQVSQYMLASNILGLNCDGMLYDVLRKPFISPFLATPEECRIYTKPSAKSGVPRLYARQRENDETPAEFYRRAKDALTEDSHGHFVRDMVHRTTNELLEYSEEVSDVLCGISRSKNLHVYRRNPGSCMSYGRQCPFYGVCTKTKTLDSVAFIDKKKKHNELVT